MGVTTSEFGYARRNAAVVAAVCALLTVAPAIMQRGVPAFQHDWLWPVTRAQCGSFMLTGALPWSPNGSGFPATYPEPWWPYAEGGILCTVLGPSAAVAAFVASFIFIAAIAMYGFCRRCGVPPIGALTGMIVYCANPVTFNKIQAGHLLFIASYSLLPIVARLSLPSPVRVQWLVLGIALGLGSAQQQFFFFDAVTALAVALTISWRWMLQTTVPAVAVALVVTMPQWITALLLVQGNAFHNIVPLQHWEYAQSAHFSEAVRLIGYIGGYDLHRLAQPARWALWAMPAFALGGIVAICAEGIGLALTALTITSLLVQWGLYGPIGPGLIWAFGHVPGFALFRELYDAAAVTGFGYAFLIAALVGSVTARSRIAGGAICVAAGAIAIYVGTRAFVQVPFYNPGPEASAYLDKIAHAGAEYRYMTIPARFPQTFDKAIGGLSPYLLGAGASASALTPDAVYPNAFAAGQLSRGVNDQQTRRALRALGVGFILRVPGVIVTSNVEPALHSLFPPPRGKPAAAWSLCAASGHMVDVVAYHAAPGTLASIRGDADLRAISGGEVIDLLAKAVASDPRRSWVPLENWALLPPWTYAVADGIFTSSSRRTFAAPAATYVAGDASGRLRAANCRRELKLDAHFAVFTCDANPEFVGTAPLVISSAVAGGRVIHSTVSTGASATVRMRTMLPFLYRFETSAKRGSAIVLRQRYDRLWTAGALPAHHVEMDGYANAWVLDKDFTGTVTLLYVGAWPYYGALALSVLLTISGLACFANGPHCRGAVIEDILHHATGDK